MACFKIGQVLSMSKHEEYRFTNKYGLPVLNDNPMSTDEADAYMDFLKEDAAREANRMRGHLKSTKADLFETIAV